VSIAVVGVCLVTLLAGFALKAQCLGGFDGREYSRLCYNDLQPLYGARGVQEGVFPYVDGGLVADELTGGAIEYPVLTGVFMWLSGLFAEDANSFLVVSAALLAPFGLLVAYHLSVMSGRRALLWAAAPAVVLYAFHNWDLLPVAASVAGFYLWSKDRSLAAAALFGVGGALKTYPLFFLAPLVLDLVSRKEARAGLRAAAAGAGTFVLINLPFLLINPRGWWATYHFHGERGPNYDSIWFLGWPSWAPERVNLVTGGLIGASFVVILLYGWVRSRGDGAYPFLQTCGALLAAFLLFNKVHSPQYTLWVLPFFALLSVSWLWWVAYSVVDLLVYVGVFRWYFDLVYGGLDDTLAKKVMIAGVWGRAGVLVLLVGVFLAARAAGDLGRRAEGELRRTPSLGSQLRGSELRSHT
jgi:uncharacterized membrane protein